MLIKKKSRNVFSFFCSLGGDRKVPYGKMLKWTDYCNYSYHVQRLFACGASELTG